MQTPPRSIHRQVCPNAPMKLKNQTIEDFAVFERDLDKDDWDIIVPLRTRLLMEKYMDQKLYQIPTSTTVSIRKYIKPELVVPVYDDDPSYIKAKKSNTKQETNIQGKIKALVNYFKKDVDKIK